MFCGNKTGQNRCDYHDDNQTASNGVSYDVPNDAANKNKAEISVPEKPPVYQIRISGHLSSEWAAYFEGLSITLEECGDTLLTGPVIDQAMLHGLFKKIRDLGLVLISVSVVDKP
jgi:hypothetical protein